MSSITDVTIAGAAACGGGRAASAGSAASVTAAAVAAEEAAAMAQLAASSADGTAQAMASRAADAALRATTAAAAAKSSSVAADSDADAAAAAAMGAGTTYIENSDDGLAGVNSVLCASATLIITAAAPASAAHWRSHRESNAWGHCGGGGGLPVWLPSPNINSCAGQTGCDSLVLFEIRMTFATASKAAQAAALLGALCPCVGGCGVVVPPQWGRSGGGAVAASRAAAARATVVRRRLRRRFRPQCDEKQARHPLNPSASPGREHAMATGLSPDVELELAVEAHLAVELVRRVSNGHSQLGRARSSGGDERATIRSVHLAVNPQPDTDSNFDNRQRSPRTLLSLMYCPFCMVPLFRPNLLESVHLSSSIPPPDIVPMCVTSSAAREAAGYGKKLSRPPAFFPQFRYAWTVWLTF